jgi:hypothetical protein
MEVHSLIHVFLSSAELMFLRCFYLSGRLSLRSKTSLQNVGANQRGLATASHELDQSILIKYPNRRRKRRNPSVTIRHWVTRWKSPPSQAVSSIVPIYPSVSRPISITTRLTILQTIRSTPTGLTGEHHTRLGTFPASSHGHHG